MNSHLSSEDMEGALTQHPSQHVRQHLARCTRCANEVAALRALFDAFRDSATATADRTSRASTLLPERRPMQWTWGLAGATAFGFGLLLFGGLHRPTADLPVPTGVTTHFSTEMSDEALLNNVQNDVAAPLPESLLPLTGTSTTSTEVKHGTQP